MKRGIKRNVLQRVNANRQRAREAIERDEQERERLRILTQAKPEKHA